MDNILIYIKMGLGIKPERKQYVSLGLFPLIATIMLGIIPGVIMKGVHLTILIILSVVSITEFVAITFLSFKPYTIKNRLLIQTLIYFGLIVTIALLELSFGLLMIKPIWIIVTYIPIVVVPLISGLIAHRQIAKDNSYDHRKFVSGRLKMSSFLFGIMGMNFAAIFRNMDQAAAIIVMLVIFTTLNIIFSFGLLSVQRLYYLSKLSKNGTCVDDEIAALQI